MQAGRGKTVQPHVAPNHDAERVFGKCRELPDLLRD